MPPEKGKPLTNEQIQQIANLDKFPGTPELIAGKQGNWHQGPDGGGQFEPWSTEWGYPEGFPLYADFKIGAQTYHVYWIPAPRDKMVILRPGETPSKYRIT